MVYDRKHLSFIAPDLSISIDKEGFIVDIGEAFEDVLGWRRDELIHKKYTEFLHEDDLKKSLEAVEEHYQTGNVPSYFENRYRHKNGGYVWFHWKGIITEEGHIYGVARDITTLKEKEFFFEEMQKIAKIGCWSLNGVTNETTFSDETYRIHELPVGDKKILDEAIKFYPAEVREYLLQKLDGLMNRKEPYDLELPFITAKGNKRVIRTTGRSFDKGGMKGAYGVIQDITEKYHAKKRLDLSKKAAKIGFWEWDAKNRILYWDESLRELYEADQYPTCSNLEIFDKRVHPEDRQRVSLQAKAKVESKDIDPMELYYRIIRSDGKIFYIKSISIVELDSEGKMAYLIGINSDITEETLKKEELDMQRAQNHNNSKLALLGEMAANIAHEINNPLSLIMGRAEYLKTKMESKTCSMEEVYEGLAQIQKVSGRIAKIIKTHKSFSKVDSNTSFINASLESLMQDALELCAARIETGGYQLHIDPIPQLELKTRGAELCQVFLNLISNSLDAIQNNTEKWIKIKFTVDKIYVLIEFVDSGLGIDEAIQGKLMHPFFTTKGKSGTGLGLSIANSIISNHNGSIYYDNTKANTTFCVKLPYIKSSY